LNSAVADERSPVAALVSALAGIDPGRPRRTVIGPGHYASVLALDDRTGIALCADGVGTKVIVAEQAGRFDTIGIDCVAMNVNDVICVGAEPIALVDYLAVEHADAAVMTQIAAGLRTGAERAGVEIPGGEVAVLPELIRGHPSPLGFDLAAACVGTVALDRLVTGERIEPGDAVIGLPSNGIHSNGLTLARRVLLEQGGLALTDAPDALGRSLADELLEPTEIYVRPVLELLRSGVDVRGLAHVTGDGLLNLLRLSERVDYEIDEPLPAQAIFDLIREIGTLSSEVMYEQFNMGTGFCCVVPFGELDAALAVLRRAWPQARRIGQAIGKTAAAAGPGRIRVPSAGIAGTVDGFARL
jgi:phosphoribosylformylglycinamidine cyclo-ligase